MTPAVRLIQVTETLDSRRFVPLAPVVVTDSRALKIDLSEKEAIVSTTAAAPSAALSSPLRKPPSPKCVVPVVFPVPLQRIVIRPRPAKLTLSQSVTRMLQDVERMTREANALLAAGDEVVPSPHSRRRRESRRKSVRFDDRVTSIASATDAVAADPTELFFGRDEIESMCNAFFEES
ncbi:hypothetical protein PINS_up014165 [Pythium insidiosum]|nr:hypothetical protein PINS_up014165 [Pythium insidiosum]